MSQPPPSIAWTSGYTPQARLGQQRPRCFPSCGRPEWALAAFTDPAVYEPAYVRRRTRTLRSNKRAARPDRQRTPHPRRPDRCHSPGDTYARSSRTYCSLHCCKLGVRRGSSTPSLPGRLPLHRRAHSTSSRWFRDTRQRPPRRRRHLRNRRRRRRRHHRRRRRPRRHHHRRPRSGRRRANPIRHSAQIRWATRPGVGPPADPWTGVGKHFVLDALRPGGCHWPEPASLFLLCPKPVGEP
jgi:hypothetical protein